MENLMWFCGGADFGHRDSIIAFLDKFKGKLQKFPHNFITTGYRPDGDVSDFMFLTRATSPERLEKAFLSFDNDDRKHIEAKSRLGATYSVDKQSFVPSLRTPVGLRRMDLDHSWDYLAHQPYLGLARVKRASGYNRSQDGGAFWRSVGAAIQRASAHLSAVRRINPFSPNMHLVSSFCSTKLCASDQLNVFAAADIKTAKALCALLNSSLFFAQFFLLKEESTGRYIDVRVYDFEQMILFPATAQLPQLADTFDRLSSVPMPSIGEQFDSDFLERYDQFWERERPSGSQKKLWPLLEKPVRPSKSRLDLDMAVSSALGVKLDAEELIELYGIFVKEMILTRGLTKD